MCVANGDEYLLEAPTSIDDTAPDGSPISYPLTNFQWFLDGIAYDDGNADGLDYTTIANVIGTYTVTAEYENGTSTCPLNGCCPIVFVEQCPCTVNIENSLVGTCTYNTDSSQSEASLTFDVSFANVASG